MSVESPLVAAAILVAIGLAVRVLAVPELVSGMVPQVSPETTAEFVGDFVVAVGAATFGLGLIDRAVGLPEVVWLAFGGCVLLAVAATPKLAGLYLRVRLGEDGRRDFK